MDTLKESPPPVLSEYGIEFFITAKHGKAQTARKHMHPAIEFIYIRSGCFEVEAEGQTSVAAKGDMLLFRSNTVHAIKKLNADIGEYYVLKMSPSFLFTMFPKDCLPLLLPFLRCRKEDTCFYPGKTLPRELALLWDTMIAEHSSNAPTFLAMQRLLACEFLLTCARRFPMQADAASDAIGLSQENLRLISDSISYINAHLSDPLTAVGCAEQVNYSYSYYAKLFRITVGKSFQEYLTELRLVHAYNLLLTSSISVSEIAVSCGYETFSHFIAEFKKKYGLPPGRLRNHLAAASDH